MLLSCRSATCGCAPCTGQPLRRNQDGMTLLPVKTRAENSRCAGRNASRSQLLLGAYNFAATPRGQCRQNGVGLVRQKSDRAIGEEPVASTGMRTPEVVCITVVVVTGPVIFRKQAGAENGGLIS